jgi:hypothetical protein
MHGAKALGRRPYQAPKLLVYGDLSEMTKGGGQKGKDAVKGNKT